MSIIGGVDAPACKHKWQVGLYRSGSNRISCGGTLISPTWVTTAKHCMGGSLDVVAGGLLQGQGQRRSVRRVINQTGADFALMELSSPFDLDGCVNVAALPSRPVAVGQSCYITGWGQTSGTGGGTARTLQEARINIVNCSGMNARAGELCVLGPNGETGCYGDSGGPLVCQMDGEWTVYGATSRGTQYCNSKAIYAGVYAAMNFIRTNTGLSAGPTPAPTPPTPPSPTPPTPTPPIGSCVHEKDCDVNPWCRDTGFEEWCRQQSNAGQCPAPYCRQA